MSDALNAGARVLSETELADRIDRDEPVAVLFYADWCPFCEAFLPVFREHLDGFDVDVVAANVSHPEDPRWIEHAVEAIPTIAVFEAGEETARLEAEAGVGLDAKALEAFQASLQLDR